MADEKAKPPVPATAKGPTQDEAINERSQTLREVEKVNRPAVDAETGMRIDKIAQPADDREFVNASRMGPRAGIPEGKKPAAAVTDDAREDLGDTGVPIDA